MNTKKAAQGVRHPNKITVTLPASMLDTLKSESKKEAVSVSALVRSALAQYLHS